MKILWVSEFDDGSLVVGYVTESGMPQYKMYFKGDEIPDNVNAFILSALKTVPQNGRVTITGNPVKLIYYYTGGVTE